MIEEIPIEIIAQHLSNEGSGVRLPCTAAECQGYRAQLDLDDISKIILYWEFEQATTNQDCRLTSLLATAAEKSRVKPFLNGDPSRGYGPADLRFLPHREPTMITAHLQSSFLYVIDGNHRIIAQQLSQQSFQDVAVYVCVWPKLMQWAYIPNYYK